MGDRAQGKVTSGSPNSWLKKCPPFVTLPENMKLDGMVWYLKERSRAVFYFETWCAPRIYSHYNLRFKKAFSIVHTRHQLQMERDPRDHLLKFYMHRRFSIQSIQGSSDAFHKIMGHKEDSSFVAL